jgi:hypothetical protein
MGAESLRKIELNYLTMYLLDENIIKMVVHERCIIGIEEVKEIQRAKRELIGDQKHKVIFITPKFGSMTTEARNYSATEDVTMNSLGKAIVLNGLAIRIIANLFIKFNSPKVEHRAFENEKEAMDWLRTLN